jgi:hypothetical protein
MEMMGMAEELQKADLASNVEILAIGRINVLTIMQELEEVGLEEQALSEEEVQGRKLNEMIVMTQLEEIISRVICVGMLEDIQKEVTAHR